MEDGAWRLQGKRMKTRKWSVEEGERRLEGEGPRLP